MIGGGEPDNSANEDVQLCDCIFRKGRCAACFQVLEGSSAPDAVVTPAII